MVAVVQAEVVVVRMRGAEVAQAAFCLDQPPHLEREIFQLLLAPVVLVSRRVLAAILEVIHRLIATLRLAAGLVLVRTLLVVAVDQAVEVAVGRLKQVVLEPGDRAIMEELLQAVQAALVAVAREPPVV